VDVDEVMSAIALTASKGVSLPDEPFEQIDYGFALFTVIKDLLNPDPHE
jgi:hypothetical protein